MVDEPMPVLNRRVRIEIATTAFPEHVVCVLLKVPDEETSRTVCAELIKQAKEGFIYIKDRE